MELKRSIDLRVQQTDDSCCPVVELRQYTLHPGKRDILIDLFEREFVESQEALGITLIGQFRDLDDPDRFVWLRGFPDMPSRARALKAFYGGPVWKKHREAANATMIDSDNVLLLHPARSSSGFSLENSGRAPAGSTALPKGLVTATIYYLDSPAEDFASFFERTLGPLFTDAGASILACFVTENSPNNFPTLPVREGEQVFVWFALFRDEAAHKGYTATFAGSQEWRGRISGALAGRIKGRPEEMRLTPTPRSRLHA